MNVIPLKDPVSHTCLADAVVLLWSLTQAVEVRGLLYFVTKFTKFRKKNLGKNLHYYLNPEQGHATGIIWKTPFYAGIVLMFVLNSKLLDFEEKIPTLIIY